MVSDRVWFLEGFGDWVMREMGDRVSLKTEMAEGESAAIIGPTRHPASRVASSYRCNRCEPESLVEPRTTPSSSLSIPVSRFDPFQPADVDVLRLVCACGDLASSLGHIDAC